MITLTILLMSGFALTSLLAYKTTLKSLRRTTEEEILPLISDSIYSDIQQTLIQPIHNSSLMANDTFLKDWVLAGEQDSAHIIKYLDRIKKKYGYFSTFFVSDITNNYYYYDGILKKISHEDTHDVWYYIFKNNGMEYDLDVDTDEASTSTLAVFINHRLEDYDGKFLGATGIGLKLENLGALLNVYREKYNHLCFMIDSKGIVQVHPDKTLVETTSIADLPGVSQVAQDILDQKETVQIHEFQYNGQHFYASARYFPDFDWFLMIESNDEIALEMTRKTTIGNLALGLFVTSFVLLIVLLTVNRYQTSLEMLTSTDELTKLNNRRYFMELAEREITSAKRYGKPLSMFQIDVDFFKTINDKYGHDIGDVVLRGLARTLIKSVREVDLIGRLGGEEFSVLLPQTDTKEALHVAERIRQAVEDQEYKTPGGTIKTSISIGIATATGAGIELADILKRADQAMYRAKDAGRNRICQDN